MNGSKMHTELGRDRDHNMVRSVLNVGLTNNDNRPSV